jgi:hypothetical protein
MTRRWEEALDAKTDIVKFWKSDLGQQYSASYLESTTRDPNPHWQGLDIELNRDLQQRILPRITDADTVYIDPDMQTVIETAARTVKLRTVYPDDILSLNAFVYLNRSIRVTDRNDKFVTFRAIHWFPIRVTSDIGTTLSGLQLCFYHDTYSHDDYTDPIERTITSRWLLGFNLPWFFAQPDNETDNMSPLSAYTGKILLSLWTLMQQRIAIRTKERVSNPFRKRATKANIADHHVTLVTLRRPQPKRSDGDHREVEWTHQWLVSGHWRNQPYRALNTTKQIWINPYVKGPDDLPLAVPTTKVYTLVR